MEEWKKIQKTYKIREIIGITGMIMFIITGAICDWNVLVESNILIPSRGNQFYMNKVL